MPSICLHAAGAHPLRLSVPPKPNEAPAWLLRLAWVVLLHVPLLPAQTTNDPFPTPIPATEGAITVSFVEFDSLPDIAGAPARPMLLMDEPGTRRIFVNDMHGLIYSLSYDGKIVTKYLDLREPAWALSVHSNGRERGFQSFAFHPQFSRPGTAGYGKFYTFTDSSNTAPAADFTSGGGDDTHDTVLLEWTARNPVAATYDGGPPRELMRFRQPFGNHNGGQLAFNPLAAERHPDFGLLYIGSADGGSGGDPLNLAQNLASAFGKILRIDPHGNNSANGKYGIPASNPFAGTGNPDNLGEIYALGVRNPQRLAWDSRTGRMFIGDIGQGVVEEISSVEAGSNLGWNKWEGSYQFVSRGEVSLANPRDDPEMIYPVAEYGHKDPLLQERSAVTMGYVYRGDAIPQLANKLLFGDIPSGEVFYVNADTIPERGQDSIRRVLFYHEGGAKTLLQLIQEKNVQQGKTPATRTDLRFGMGPEEQIFILNKADGVIRLLVPDDAS